MAEHFFNLKCTNCGADLEVYPDMERFVCGYCGTGLVAMRRGGTISLSAVTGAIRQVQIGTDKTAAELAIVRYQNDLYQLKSQRAILEKTLAKANLGILVGVSVALVGAFILAEQGSFTLLILGGCVGCVSFLLTRANSTAIIDAKIKTLQQKIMEKKKIADG